MKVLRQLAIILGILLAGEAIRSVTKISIPGTVIGMVILFLGLMTKVIKPDDIGMVTKFLLDHLAFMFVPAGVGLISSLDVVGAAWLPILMIVVISTVLVVGVTGWTVQLLKRRRI
ncbi:CidA/LrgA family protein [Youngiibacter multivorans]|uniref:Holin-like protein n=1 Tax=Youngiibacter multivorans TaxID=937251 RepID=A0ABS4FZD7_9CLOT|nr:CidA/LrgA family protein [Youngiibacter multivorans]MBP1917626.1 holin-like protein [Youngiibacter multivorans]